MPELHRSSDALDAATEIWTNLTTDTGNVVELRYGSTLLTFGYCEAHKVHELVLSADANNGYETFGIADVHSVEELARAIDSVMCLEQMCRNLVTHLLPSHMPQIA